MEIGCNQSGGIFMLATYKAFLGNFRSCLMVVVLSQVSGFALLAQDAPSTKQVESGAIDFAHDIVPILRDKCARCHTNGTYK